jgi:hypothetical protein
MPESLAIPPDAGQAINRLIDELAQACGANLVSVVAYGSAVSGRFRAGGSDVNLLVVLREADVATLDAVGRAVCTARAVVPVSLMVAREAELPLACEAFPVKFLEIEHVHAVLHGADVLEGMAAPRERLLDRCRQEAINLAWRLRQAVALRGDGPGLSVLAERFLPLLLSLLRALVHVRTEEWVLSRDEVIDRAGELLGIEAAGLRQLLAWRKGQLHLTDAEWLAAMGDLLRTAEAVVEAVHGS